MQPLFWNIVNKKCMKLCLLLIRIYFFFQKNKKQYTNSDQFGLKNVTQIRQ